MLYFCEIEKACQNLTFADKKVKIFKEQSSRKSMDTHLPKKKKKFHDEEFEKIIVNFRKLFNRYKKIFSIRSEGTTSSF